MVATYSDPGICPRRPDRARGQPNGATPKSRHLPPHRREKPRFHPGLNSMRAIAASLIVLVCLTSRAQAQVSVDMRALDAPGGARTAAPVPVAPTPRAAPAPWVASPPRVAPAQAVAPTPGVESQPAPERRAAKPAPPVPVARNPASPVAPVPARARSAPASDRAPSQAVVPIPALPTAQPAPPPPVATAPPAPAPVQTFPAPIRVVFDDGKTDLSAGEEARIRALARAIPAATASSVNVTAYAAGKSDDPSTARRLSLSRGLAVRTVLLDCGIPSSQIYVRAMGSKTESGPPNRVELTVARPGEVTR